MFRIIIFLMFLNQSITHLPFIKISINFVMSIRKEHKRKLHPILNIIKSALELGPRDVPVEQQISKGIVEEIMQTDALSKIHSLSTLRYIAYELILYSCQQNVKTSNTQENTQPQGSAKTGELLGEMRAMLADLTKENEDFALKSVGFENERYLGRQNNLSRNKMRVFSNYFNQLCLLLEDKGPKQPRQINKDNQKQEALIDQLEHLVLKKEEQLKESIHEKRILEEQLTQLQDQISAFRIESSVISADCGKLKLEKERVVLENERVREQNQKLRQQIQLCEQRIEEGEMMRQINFKTIDNVVMEESPSSLLFSHDITQHQYDYQSDQVENEYIKLLLTQAMTIQAFIK